MNVKRFVRHFIYRSGVEGPLMALDDHIRHLMPMGSMSNLKHGKVVFENTLMAFMQCLVPNMLELLFFFLTLGN